MTSWIEIFSYKRLSIIAYTYGNNDCIELYIHMCWYNTTFFSVSDSVFWITRAYVYVNFCTHLDWLLNLQSMNRHGLSRTSDLQEYSKNLWTISPSRKSSTYMFSRFRPPSGSDISSTTGQHSIGWPSMPPSLRRVICISRTFARLVIESTDLPMARRFLLLNQILLI